MGWRCVGLSSTPYATRTALLPIQGHTYRTCIAERERSVMWYSQQPCTSAKQGVQHHCGIPSKVKVCHSLMHQCVGGRTTNRSPWGMDYKGMPTGPPASQPNRTKKNLVTPIKPQKLTETTPTSIQSL